jgi:hypothetical protein
MDINEKRNDPTEENNRLEQADIIANMEEQLEEEKIAVNEPVLPSKLHQALITNDKAALFEMANDNSAPQLADALNPLTDNEIKMLAYERALKEDEDFRSDVEYYFGSTSFGKVTLGKKAKSRYGDSAEIEFIITENEDTIIEIIVD